MKASGSFDAETTFSEFLSSWLKLETETNHNWFYYTKKLQEMLYDQTDLPIHSVYYEDMKSNPVDEVKKIVEYLGINRADDFIHQIVDKCCFDNLKKADNTKVAPLEGVRSKHFHLCEVGDWKNHFTVAENEEFDRIYNERMKDIKFTYKYTLKPVD
ncbi:SULT1 [Mytilus edulis]|uniref:SULT1 n=1 Tax=Mytilus edulis TaxID=6550 RepID=A0A8S3RHE2_MYTED|nr:SULT1 [Mytilus edulis]